VDAQAAQVRDARKRPGQFGELGRGQRQRIAAGQDDFLDRRIGGDERDGLAPAAAEL